MYPAMYISILFQLKQLDVILKSVDQIPNVFHLMEISQNVFVYPDFDPHLHHYPDVNRISFNFVFPDLVASMLIVSLLHQEKIANVSPDLSEIHLPDVCHHQYQLIRVTHLLVEEIHTVLFKQIKHFVRVYPE